MVLKNCGSRRQAEEASPKGPRLLKARKRTGVEATKGSKKHAPLKPDYMSPNSRPNIY